MSIDMNVVIDRYFGNKTRVDTYKKLVDKDNKIIKDEMNKLGVYEWLTDTGVKAKGSVTERYEFNEDALIDKVKALGLEKELVRTKEYVDMSALESAIYSGKINAIEFEDCRVKKEVFTLRVKKGS